MSGQYVIRYRPGTDLAEKFGAFTFRPWHNPSYPSREVAEQVLAQLRCADSMEIVELEGEHT